MIFTDRRDQAISTENSKDELGILVRILNYGLSTPSFQRAERSIHEKLFCWKSDRNLYTNLSLWHGGNTNETIEKKQRLNYLKDWTETKYSMPTLNSSGNNVIDIDFQHLEPDGIRKSYVIDFALNAKVLLLRNIYVNIDKETFGSEDIDKGIISLNHVRRGSNDQC